MLGTLLVVGLLIALAAYAVAVLTRALRTQRARSEERATALMLELQARTAAGSNAATAAPNSLRSSERRFSQAPSAIAAGPTHGEPGRDVLRLQALRRERLLTDPQRLLYLLVRDALPDHIVLANMRAIDLLDLPAGPEPLARDPRLGILLHQRLDCVVCRGDLTPLAALVLHADPDAGSPAAREAGAMLRELGLRFLRFRSDSLPRPAEMRALILG